MKRYGNRESLLLRNSIKGDFNPWRGWTPAQLFAGNSAPGCILDPTIIGSMAQDAANTTPITGAGQPIGRFADVISGRGVVFSASGTKRPLYQIDANGRPYVYSDGIDDAMASVAAINASGYTQLTLIAGIRKTSDAARGMVWEHSVGGQTGNAALNAPVAAAGANYAAVSNGGTAIQVNSPSSYPAPITNVVAMRADTVANALQLYVNGAQVASSTTAQGGSGYANAVTNLFARSGTSLFFTGYTYRMLWIFRALTTDEFTRATAWVNQNTGAF